VAGAFAVAAMTLVGPGTADAGFTDVAPAAPGEPGHEAVLSAAYGGSFTWDANGVDLVGGGSAGDINATRISDANDQFWLANGLFNARAIARFAGFDQAFGYMPGESSTAADEFVHLFDVEGSNYDVTGASNGVDLTGLESFRWARQGPDGTHTSYEPDNDGMDHMVTYQIHGLNTLEPVYLLFFEDGFRDWDYQDVVIEIAGAAVPSPAAIGPGLALLGFVGLTRRRRNRA
jgi:hypothetical protein